MKRIFFLFLLVFTFLPLLLRSQNTANSGDVFSALNGPYLGQNAPGDTAVLFAPGIVCTGMDDRDITISPDGKEIFYGVLEKPHYVIVCLKEIKGVWQQQEIAGFSGSYNDYEPQFSPDGKRLYFCSDRPLEGNGEPKDSDIWFVEREGDDWGPPQNLGAPVNTDKDEFYPSLTKNGTLYFTSHDMKICKAELVNGKYADPVMLSDSINTRAEYNAYVDPDETYLIFTSHSWGSAGGRGDLFISFKMGDTSWTTPIHLGPEINSASVDLSPTVSPDGKYLFFSSNRTVETYDPQKISSYMELLENFQQPQNKKLDIYWVSATFIEKHRPVGK